MARQEGNDGNLTLSEHLDELRHRLFIASLGAVGGTIIAIIFHRRILEFLTRPAGDTQLIVTAVTENLGIAMKVSFMGGFIIALPLLVYQAVMFASPGLTPRERRYLFLSLPGITFTFVGGVAFGYYVLIPPAMAFLLGFNADIAEPFITIGNYINLTVSLLFWMGVVFETPVLMFILAKLRLVRHTTFARWRRLAVVMAFVLGAIITPTFDPINQSFVAVPIIFLYETGIWLAWLARRGEKEESADKATAAEPGG